MRGCIAGRVPIRTVSTNDACTSPISAPSHHVAMPQAWNAATYRSEKSQPFTKWTSTPTSFARSRSGVKMVPSR
jgi:hypothetical protein